MTIKFGTDGWRAIVGKDFTQQNVTQIIEAFAAIYPTLPEAGRPVVIGYDMRNQSPETATLIAELLAARGITPILSRDFCPTPAVAWTVVRQHAAAGIMVTASHNPPEWNGIKFKESYGGAASPEFTNPIEQQIQKGAAAASACPAVSLQSFDPKHEYLNHLRNFVDGTAIAKARFKILFDPLYGSGASYLAQMIDGVTEIHGQRDLRFGGIHPEPIVPYVNEAIQTMRGGQYDVCIITDGDADRIGAIDERGTYLTSHEIYGLLLQHVLTHRGWRGNVVKSITTTRMINGLCRQFGLQLTTTPVGFKYISPALKGPNMLVGGEESGGIGFPRHVCERDGLLCGLLILEMMAVRGKPLSALVAELQTTYGPCRYRRVDLKLTPEQMQLAKARLANLAVTSLCGRPIEKIERIDGYHLLRDDESWLLIRPSGTEPLLRTYAEARTDADVAALLQEAQRMIGLAE
ncbi:MAG: phosphoglucomutase/phosphomannomutase family protein [Deltaproteobacteria bacterium]|nr:phosphoglucomutase/phosphomannomutase family protein [Deltaproteobacteria bacterium]